jgi:hypothetical protein
MGAAGRSMRAMGSDQNCRETESSTVQPIEGPSRMIVTKYAESMQIKSTTRKQERNDKCLNPE